MTGQFWFNLHTRHKLDSADEAAVLLTLLESANGICTPKFFGTMEPLKTALDASSRQQALDLLSGGSSHRSGSLMLGPQKSKTQAWIRWHSQKPNTWQFFLDMSVLSSPGTAQVVDFFAALCQRFPALTGGGAPYEDWQAKHWQEVVSAGGARGVRKMGFDYRGTPTGVYWLTVLGPEMVAHFGKEAIGKLDVHRIVDLQGGGMLLVLRPEADAPSLAERLAHDSAVAEALGADYFFDIAQPERALAAIPGL